MAQPADALGIIDQLFFRQFLPVEHRPPFGLGLAAMKFEELAHQLTERQLGDGSCEQSRNRVDRPLLALQTTRFAFRVGLLARGAVVPRNPGRAQREKPTPQQQRRAAIDLVIVRDLLEQVRLAQAPPLLVDDDAGRGGFHLALAAGHVERFEILDRVAWFGDPHGLANDAVEIDEFSLPEQIVDLVFPSAVEHGEAFEGALFVSGVMIDMCVGSFRQTRRDEIDGLLEGLLLTGTIMAPKRRESWPFGLFGDEAEEIFEPAVEERIALHVEEQITRARPRQTSESLAGRDVQKLVTILAICPFRDLKARLAAKTTKGVRLQIGDPCAGREPSESRHRRHSGSLQLRHLAAGDVGDEAEMVGRLPFGVAAVAPAAQAAMAAGLGDRHGRNLLDKGLKALASNVEVIVKIRQRERDGTAIAEDDMDVWRHESLFGGEQERIDAKLQDVLGLCRPRQLGVDWLVAERTAPRCDRHADE